MSKAISRRKFIKLGGQILLGGTVLSVFVPFYATQLEPAWIEIAHVDVPVADLPEPLQGLTLLQISDMHLGPLVTLEYLQRVVEIANEQGEPDFVFLTGDFVTAEAHYSQPAAQALSKLRSRYGQYAVLGNHDIWTDAGTVAQNLEAQGITVLRNTRIPLQIGGASLWLLGIEDRGYTGSPGEFDTFRAYWQSYADELADLLVGIPETDPRLLLVHNPDFTQMLPPGRIDLALSGHTHGGQVRLPLLGSPFIPSCFGDKFLGGLVNGSATQVYVNRGVGTTGFKMRFNARPEITYLRLVSENRLQKSS